MDQNVSEQATLIREIERQIDAYFENLEFFKYDRRSLLIETIKYLQNIIYEFEKNEGDNLLSIMLYLNRYINAVNKMIEGILTFSENNEKREFKILDLYSLCENYGFIYDAFVAYSRGLYDATFDSKKKLISFQFNDKNAFSKRIFISDYINKMVNKAVAVSNGMKSISQLQSSVHPPLELNGDNIRLVNKLMEPLLNQVVSQHFDTQIQLPTEWDLIGVTMDEYKVGWCALTRLALKKTGEDYISMFLKKDFNPYIIYHEEELLKIIQDDKICISKAEKILKLLVYNHDIKNNNIIYHPIIQIDKKEVIFIPSLFTNFIPQDNFIAIVNKINNKLYNQLSNQKEDIMIGELNSFFISQSGVFFKSKINLPNNLPDIDYLIYDSKTQIVFIIELKFLLKSHNVKEKFARDDEIQNGIAQVMEYKDYVIQNIDTIIKSTFDIIPNQSNICFFVLSKNGIYSGNYSMDIPVINQSWFQALLLASEFNFEIVLNIILEREYLPKEGVDFIEGINTFEFGGYNFSIPLIKPIIMPEANNILLDYANFRRDYTHPQRKLKVKRNAPCPCGSGLKYKKCCGSTINAEKHISME